ncbi:MAG TPA: TonB-dependent receptor, partial [Casimicrobium huifangae]|nr:TonB-dependent receptor [Casimicrobium huifangae]
EDLGTVFDISTRRLAYYVQDEWDPAPNWAANVGLRYEEIQTKSSSAEDGFVNTSRVLTPLAHVVWRFASPRRDQVRLSLTQSYRAPNVGQLTPKPTLSVSYPVPGSNLYTAPDRAGNPMLKPERANGLDLAYEHYLSAGGIMSANLFARQLHDVIRNVTSLEDVSWASSPRYVNRPQNLGDAKTYGIELEAKFRVSELMADAGALGRLSVKMNGSFYTSKVAAIPGPDNRIDGQPAFTGNLGLDYRFTGVPLAIGGNLAWTPSYEVQQTETQRQKLSTRRVFDAYATWNFTPGTRLRFSASNIAPLDSVTQTTNFEGNIRQSTLGVARTYVNYALRLEVRL